MSSKLAAAMAAKEFLGHGRPLPRSHSMPQTNRNRQDDAQPQNETNGRGTGNKPIAKFQAPVSNGTIEVSVFENEYDGRNGKNGSRSYRSGDLPALALLLQRAFHF